VPAVFVTTTANVERYPLSLVAGVV